MATFPHAKKYCFKGKQLKWTWKIKILFLVHLFTRGWMTKNTRDFFETITIVQNRRGCFVVVTSTAAASSFRLWWVWICYCTDYCSEIGFFLFSFLTWFIWFELSFSANEYSYFNCKFFRYSHCMHTSEKNDVRPSPWAKPSPCPNY